MLAEPLAPSPIRGLAELFAMFDEYSERIPLDELASGLARLDLTQEDLSGFSIFDAECYCRNQLKTGPAYEALLICWRSGQRSPIHDHVGSSCAFRVLQGDCTETVYEPGPARVAGSSVASQVGTAQSESSPLVVAISRNCEAEGFVCATQDEDIHEVANFGSDNLQTLHIYSPPMAKMGIYRAEGVEAPAALPADAFASGSFPCTG